MIPLESLSPQSAEAVVKLKTGREVKLTMRPYTLHDHAWFQKQFGTDEDKQAIAAMRLEPIARFSWHMLTPESRAVFANIKYEKYDDDGNPVKEIEGYERLLFGIESEESFWALLSAFGECRGMNSFISDEGEIGVKKKAIRSPKRILIGLVSLILWPLNMVIRLIKFLLSPLASFNT